MVSVRATKAGMTEHILHLLGPFSSPGLSPRLARVYVPPARPARGKGSLPVLCLFDGQNIFHDEPSFVGGWQLHKAAYRLAKKGERMPILVGIDHGGHARINELSPFPTRSGEGHLPALLDLVCGTILPLVRRTFGASTESVDTGIGGSSMGGLAALWAHYQAPDQFGLAMSMSPSLQIGHGAIFDWLVSRPRPSRSRIYLDAGGREAGGSMLMAATQLSGMFRQRGYNEESLRFVAAKAGAHNEKAWRRRAPGAIRFLFGGG